VFVIILAHSLALGSVSLTQLVTKATTLWVN